MIAARQSTSAVLSIKPFVVHAAVCAPRLLTLCATWQHKACATMQSPTAERRRLVPIPMKKNVCLSWPKRRSPLINRNFASSTRYLVTPALPELSGANSLRYHSIVRSNPVRKSTRGDQPSKVRALVISGRRRHGSSTGRGS